MIRIWNLSLFGLLVVASGSVCLSASANDALEIYFIDVQGGAATLIVSPEKESILIDSGWPGQNDRDPKRIEHIVKNIAGLKQIDHLVTTHWHMDHYGGVEGLSKRLKIEHFWDRGLPDLEAPEQDKVNYPDGPNRDDPLGIAYRKVTDGKRKTLKAGDSLPLKGKLESLVLASGGETLSRERKPNMACEAIPADLAADPSDNARSLAIRFRLGTFTFLDCGDLTWNVERKLICPTDLIGQVDLFQVTHHGMAISNHPTLLETIRPTVAVIDNGPSKGGDPKTFARLKSLKSLQGVYQLHKNQATIDSENAEPGFIANSKPEGGEFIKVTVDPKNSSFHVQIGEHGEAQKFDEREP